MTAVVLAMVMGAYIAVGLSRGGAAWGLGTLLLLIILAPLLFAPVKVEVEGNTLAVRMVALSARYDLGALHSAERVSRSEVFSGAYRTCASGGLFGYYGYFRGGPLGKFTAYVTDAHKLVLLRFQNTTVVVSPRDPDALLKTLPHVSVPNTHPSPGC